MAIELTDDGTLDTVLRCTDCGQEMRYNFDGSDWADVGTGDMPCPAVGSEELYARFVAECIEDATADHECSSEDEEPSEPQEDDLTTEDHAKFYQNGRRVLQCVDEGPIWTYRPSSASPWIKLGSFGDDHVAAIRAYMDRVQFWPNAWFISDHGNAHLMDLNPEAK
jgi:hypothetical protein